LPPRLDHSPLAVMASTIALQVMGSPVCARTWTAAWNWLSVLPGSAVGVAFLTGAFFVAGLVALALAVVRVLLRGRFLRCHRFVLSCWRSFFHRRLIRRRQTHRS
jgi:hypothetical protein